MIGLGVSSFSHFDGVHFQNAHELRGLSARSRDRAVAALAGAALTPKQKLIREMILQLKTGALETDYFQAQVRRRCLAASFSRSMNA